MVSGYSFTYIYAPSPASGDLLRRWSLGYLILPATYNITGFAKDIIAEIFIFLSL
jgi:hypothetical protein